MADQRNGGIVWADQTALIKALRSRFLGYVDKTDDEDDCWIWNAGKFSNGYGQFRLGKIKVKAHRLAYFYHHGEINNELRVLHKCDNPPCCNPHHLFLGTDADNVADRERKGRGARSGTSLPCAKNPSAKLTEEAVIEIRRMALDGIFLKQIASQFGMRQSQIGNIVRGDSWRM